MLDEERLERLEREQEYYDQNDRSRNAEFRAQLDQRGPRNARIVIRVCQTTSQVLVDRDEMTKRDPGGDNKSRRSNQQHMLLSAEQPHTDGSDHGCCDDCGESGLPFGMLERHEVRIAPVMSCPPPDPDHRAGGTT